MSEGRSSDVAGSLMAVMLAAVLVWPGVAHAQEERGDEARAGELDVAPGAAEPEYTAEFAEGMEEADPNTGAIGLSGGVDFVTAYWFRGIAQENEGLIVQPSLEASFDISEPLSLYVGVWNSLHENDMSTWFEADWYAGVSADLGEGFNLDVSYINLYGPSAGDIFAEEFDITLSYDDSGMWGEGEFALSPYITYVFETDGGSDGLYEAGDLGQYAEVGIAPSFALTDKNTDYPITLAVPVTVGLNVGDYYENAEGVDSTLGFVDVGLVASTPLAFMPSEYGEWTLSAGVHGIYLGDGAQQISSTDFNVTGDDEFHVWGSLGISFEY